jgi:hypothetical protein
MYCTTDVTFYCQGGEPEARPKFQAMLADLATMLRDRHPDVTAPDINEPLTPDDLHEVFDREEDFEGLE